MPKPQLQMRSRLNIFLFSLNKLYSSQKKRKKTPKKAVSAKSFCFSCHHKWQVCILKNHSCIAVQVYVLSTIYICTKENVTVLLIRLQTSAETCK